MTYKQEIEKLKERVSNYKKKLLAQRKHEKELQEQTELKATIAHEKRTIPKSGGGLFLLDLVLSFEKYVLKIR